MTCRPVVSHQIYLAAIKSERQTYDRIGENGGKVMDGILIFNNAVCRGKRFAESNAIWMSIVDGFLVYA